MKKYTFSFSGEVTVIADSEQVGYQKADGLVAPTFWASENCESITVDNIELIDTEEVDG